jgi:hypothetical protein
MISSMATTISTAESTVRTTTTDSCGLSGLGGGIGLVGRLLGSGEIGQFSLRLVGQVLGVVDSASRSIATVM